MLMYLTSRSRSRLRIAPRTAAQVNSLLRIGLIVFLALVFLGSSPVRAESSEKKTGSARYELPVAAEQQADGPPQVETPISDMTLQEGSDAREIGLDAVFRVPGNDDDDDDSELSYSASSSNSSIVAVNVSGNTLRVRPLAAGNVTVSVTASNDKGTATDEFVVTVTGAPNQAPQVVDGIDDVSLQQGASALQVGLSGVFNDPDGNPLTFNASSSNSGIASVRVSGSTLSVEPLTTGTATITVTASDGNGGSATDNFSVTVTSPPNRPPVVAQNLDDLTRTEGDSPVTISLSGVFSDPDNDPLTLSASSNTTTVASTSISGDQLTVTLGTAGTASVTVRAEDGRGGSATESFTVTVNENPNGAPTVRSPISDRTMVLGGADLAIEVSNTFSDPDNDPLTFLVTSSNSGVASASLSGNTLTVRAIAVGQTTISVTANDGNGGTVSDNFAVEVTTAPNQPPVVTQNLGDVVRTEGDPSVSLDLSEVFSDPDGDALAFSVTSSNTAVATASVSGDQLLVTIGMAGTTTVSVTAQDEAGGSVTESFNVTVNQGENGPPVVRSPISDRELVLGGADFTIDLSNVFNDPEDDPLTLSASSSNPSVATVAITGDNLSVSTVSLGTTTITVTATDDAGNSEEERFVITVQPGNRPPVVDRTLEDRQVIEGSAAISITLDEVFTDPDGDPLTFSVRSNNPNVATVSLSEDELTVTPIQEGQTIVTVTASDRRGGSTSAQFTISVTSATAVANTLPASDINSTRVTLNGSINTAGQPAEFFFEYGLTESYGETTPERDAGSATGFQPVSEQVTGLTPNTTYHFRVVTVNQRGRATYGDDEIFSTTAGPNKSPEVSNPIADRSLTLNDAGFTINLTTVFRDPEGDALVFAEPIVSEPGIIDASLDTGVLTVSPIGEGQVNITLEARDSDGAIARDRFYVTVTKAPNQNPQIVAEIGEILFEQGDSIRRIGLGAYFQDPENDPLVFEALSEDPTTATVQVNGDTLGILPHNPGETTVTVTAEDARGGTASQQFTVRVTQRPNSAPSVSQGLTDSQVQLDGLPLTIDITNVFEDPDGDTLSYTALSEDPDLATVQIDGNQLIVTPISAGQTTITLTARDNHGSSTQDSFTLTVEAAGDVTVGDVEFQEQTSVGEPLTIRARIENTSGNSSVFLHYRSGEDATFISTEMSLSGGMFEALIPANAVTSDGLQWYIEVANSEGSISTSDFFTTRVEHPGFDIQLPGGDEQNAYRLISTPLELANKSATAVLEDDLGAYDDSKWRFFTYVGAGEFKEGPSGVSLEPGRSYWLITRENTEISTGSGLSMALADFSIELESGCNFVANPFSFPVPVNQVSLVQGGQIKLWTYNGQWNPGITALEPGQGYVTCTPTADRMVVSPFQAGVAGKRSSRSLASSKKYVLDWSIRIQARSQNAVDAFNYAAVSASALEGLDEMDWMEPPVIGAYVSARFRSEKGNSAAFDLSTDVRPAQKDGYVWNLEVRSNIEDRVDMVFDQIDQVPAELEVWLIDESLKIQQNLRENNRYAFAASGEHAPRRLQVVVGIPGFLTSDVATPAPDRFEVAQNHPNPFSSITTIRYEIPENEAVTVTIYDILGKEIVTLEENQSKTAGSYTVTWDGSDNRGVPVATGTYICRVQTNRQQASRVMTFIR